MPLNIGRVDARINVGTESSRSPDDGSAAGGASARPEGVGGAELMARLRPLVIEILEQELTRFQRQQG